MATDTVNQVSSTKVTNSTKATETKSTKKAQKEEKVLDLAKEDEQSYDYKSEATKNLDNVKEMLANGTLTKERGTFFFFFHYNTGNYVYTADGEKNLGEIKESMGGVKEGRIKDLNSTSPTSKVGKDFLDLESEESQKVFRETGSYDNVVPKKDTKIVIDPDDILNLPDEKIVTESGNEIYKSALTDKIYYNSVSEDCPNIIINKFANDKEYKLVDAEAVSHYSEFGFQSNTKIAVKERNWLEKLLFRPAKDSEASS
jgi:hypothetical protein